MEILSKGSVIVRGGVIEWIGPERLAPKSATCGCDVFDAQACAVLPALIDCHTHLLYGGDRVEDFVHRSEGESYAERAQRGGGIMTTVRATREAPDEALLERARHALKRRQASGIAVTEIKSGYGLSFDSELRMLRLIRRLRQEAWDVEATLLAAHVPPPDMPREQYVTEICERMIPQVARDGLATAVDVFVETGAFTVSDAERIAGAATQHGLRFRAHAEQITHTGATRRAAELGAQSVDHLERVNDDDLRAMAKAGTVGVLLPGAMTYLGDQASDLGQRLVAGGVEVAVATDANPGSSPSHNLPLMATLACTQMGLTAGQALRAITRGGASALGRTAQGDLRPGHQAEFVVLTEPRAHALPASFGEPVIRDLVRVEAE